MQSIIFMKRKKVSFAYFLETYLPSLVETMISSPCSINNGTLTNNPVSMIASLVALVAVLPLVVTSDMRKTLMKDQ